jgi:peroxiredoxin
VPLLADVDKDVARKYDAFSSRLGVKRAVIVIDEQGSCVIATTIVSAWIFSPWMS